MSNNLESDRSVSTGKMYPIDLAPQKITIVKGVSNSDVKMAHLISGQTKTTNSNQHGPHASQTSGIMRSSLAQIISSNSTSQPQMIVSGSPILQGTQILSQGSQLHGQSTQIINQSQLITPSGQIISPGTQIISQGTQLSAQVVSTNSGSSGSVQSNVVSPGGTQVLSMGSQLASGASNLVVNSSVRTLPQTVRVLPPQPLHNSRPVQLSTVNVTNASNVLVSKNVNVGVTSHVPRGLAAGASLAMRPVAPSAASQPASNQGSGWGTSRTARGALVYGPRGRTTHTLGPHTPTINSSSVISGSVRGVSPRPSTPVAAPTTLTPRPLPLLQRNYQPAKPAAPGGVGPRGAVGNSAPAQLYYEVPRAARPPPHAHGHAAHVNVINAAVQSVPDNRPPPSAVQTVPVLARPTILRKRDVDGSPTKAVQPPPVLSYPAESVCPAGPPGWEDVCSAGSTTESAASSPARDLDRDLDLEPRKKPRKQLLSNEVRQCDYPPEDPPSSPPQVTINPPPKRPLLRSQFVCGWRSTALHFARPADVRRREPKPRDIVSIASQRHVLSSADGWKVHHLTAQMDDLMSLESDVGLQLAGLLRTLETASGKALSALQPQSHTLLELLKGNIQRSKIVCEGIQEARQDILRVFTHRKSVSDILARQADKRCFRKHRSQS